MSDEEQSAFDNMRKAVFTLKNLNDQLKNSNDQLKSELASCSKHKKEIAGISDMKLLAEMIGDLHYETLNEFLAKLSEKLYEDGKKDLTNGRKKLGTSLISTAAHIYFASIDAVKVWEISKPFMKLKSK